MILTFNNRGGGGGEVHGGGASKLDLAVFGVPNAQHGNGVRTGYLTLVVLGVHPWVKRLHKYLSSRGSPTLSTGPCPLRGQHVGKVAT